MRQQTKRFLSTIFSLILLTAALLVYVYLIRPAYQEEQAIKSKQLSQQAFLDYESAAIKQVKSLIENYQGQLQIQEAVSQAFPAQRDEAGALAQIYGLVQNAGLQLQSISVSESAGGARSSSVAGKGEQAKFQKPTNSLVMQLKASGPYENLKIFISELETNIRIFDLKSLSIQPASPAQQSKSQVSQDFYSVDISLTTYYQGQ